MHYKKSPCTIVLLAVNTAVFIVLSFIGMTEDAYFMLDHGAMYAPLFQQGEYYRLFTSMFLHFSFSHLINNMLMLGVLGSQLEQVTGSVRYALLYAGSGIAGNLLSLAAEIHSGEYAVSAGASGAVFGVMGALLYVAVRNHGRIGTVSGRGIMIMAGLTLYYGFTSTGVDNFAHIGGFAAGVILALFLYRKRDTKECAGIF